MNKEMIVFDEEGGKLISIQEVRTISFSEFIDRLQVQRISTPILPRAIWYEDTGVDKMYAIETPPRRRVVPYFEKYYDLGFPALIFLVRTSGNYIANVALAVATSDINDFEDQLFRLPLPNMDDRSLLCLGTKFDTEIAGMTDLLKKVKYVLSFFETSRYNDHLLPLHEWIPDELRGDYNIAQEHNPIDSFHGVLARWQELTKGEDWLQVVNGTKKTGPKISWIPFKTFRQFTRETT